MVSVSRAIQRACAAGLVAAFGCGDGSRGGFSGAPLANPSSPSPSPSVEPRARAVPPPAEPAARFTHEGDREYQNGLVKFMHMAPLFGDDGVELVTSVFRVGYLTGLQEANEYQTFMDGKVSSLGCTYGFAAIREYFAQPSDAEVARTKDLCASKRPESGIQGPRFAASRLNAAQTFARRFRDPRQIEILTSVHVVGYNMGFAHEWEAVDQETHVEQIVNDRCSQVVQKIEPPLSPAQLEAAAAKCKSNARQSKAEFGHQLRCLLVGPDMNGDLSGLANKPGCTHK